MELHQQSSAKTDIDSETNTYGRSNMQKKCNNLTGTKDVCALVSVEDCLWMRRHWSYIYIKGMMEVRKAKLAKHAHIINEGGAP